MGVLSAVRRVLSGAVSAFGYDAAESKGKRKAPSGRLESEDRVLNASARAKLTSASRDIQRNFTIAAWMIRKHLDYVSQFGFHSRSGIDELDDQVEELMREWSEPENCDAAGRHSFDKLIRLAEARRTIDGDVGLLKLADGRLQGIEGDRIRTPSGVDARENWIHGVRVDVAGRALAYAIHKRNGASFTFERNVPAEHLEMHGFYDRFDQVRGVSPIAAALNGLRDVYENFDYALAKAKVSQLFALVFYRDAMAAVDEGMPGGDSGADDDDETNEGYPQVNFGGGPVQLDLDPGDRAEFLESQTPSTQFQDFTRLMVMVVLKALDIPYSFYDEAHTNFFGSRGSWLHYERSCKDKRDDVLRLLRSLTRWRLRLWVQDGVLTLPEGLTVERFQFEWVPLGMPWWDPSKEISGDLAAIKAGLDNPQRICKERGRGDFYDNIDRIAEAVAYAREKGVALDFAPIPQSIEVVERDAQ